MNELQQYGFGQQLAPQSILGSFPTSAFGGFGRNIASPLGAAPFGQMPGQIPNAFAGSMLPFGADPVTAAYAQQAQQQQLQQQIQQQQQQQQLQQQLQQAQMGQQFGPQGWLGNLISQVGQPLGGAVGTLFGQPGLGSTIGGMAGQLGRMLPFGVDPVAAAYAQQAQQAQQSQFGPQGWLGNLISQVGQPLGGAVGTLFGQPGLGSTIGGMAGQLGRMLPFAAGPQQAQQPQQIQQQLQQLQQIQQQLQQQQMQYAQIAQQLAQQLAQQGQPGQMGPQGWLGNIIGQVGQPLGSAIGDVFGNAGLGSTIGAAAGQLGRMLPFGVDPLTAAYAQQAQLAQQAQYGQPGAAYGQGAGQPTVH